MTRLTHNNIHQLGFRGGGKTFSNVPLYRLKVPANKKFGYYGYEIQLEIRPNLPLSNPNCGILSIYDPEIKDIHVFTSETEGEEAMDFVIEELPDGEKVGIKYMSFPERIVPIAWHVGSFERLNRIYMALTGNVSLKFRKYE